MPGYGERGWRVTHKRASKFSLLILIGALGLLSGCLGQRLTAAQVVFRTQQVLSASSACHSFLDMDINTDMIKDSLVVEVWEKQGSRVRLTILSATSPQLRGLTFTTDRKTSLSYSPHTNTTSIGPADLVRLPRVIETLLYARNASLQSFDPQKARLLARVRESGLMVYKLEIPLSPDEQAEYTIDARDWRVRQIDYQSTSWGSGTVRLKSIECFADLDDAVLDLDIPEGAVLDRVTVPDSRALTLEEAQRAVDFRLRLPGYLPADTTFAMAFQLDKNMALVYTGSHSFTLAQGPNIGQTPQENVTLLPLRGVQGTLVQDNSQGGLLLTWREDELQFSIAGSLSLNEILQIAESLK